MPGVQEAQNSAQLQMQQYVVDIQALERNGDALARELQAAKGEAEDLARDRNRVVEQMQAAQVLTLTFRALCVPAKSRNQNTCQCVTCCLMSLTVRHKYCCLPQVSARAISSWFRML